MKTGCKEYNISKDDSYLGKVNKAIEEITAAIKNDDESGMSDSTYKLLSFSSLPIYNILRINATYFKENSTEVGSIAEFLAMDILYGYLQSVNQTVRKAAAKYDSAAYEKIFKNFFENQREIRRSLDSKREALSGKFADKIRILERTSKIEEMLAHNGQAKVKFGMR